MLKPSIQTFLQNKLFAYTGAFAFLIAAGFAGISIGTIHVPFRDIAFLLSHHLLGTGLDGVNPTFDNIVWKIRLPRVLLAGLVGASLAVAGAAFQGLLRNPLADPFTLGVSSGASVGAVMVLFFHLSLPWFGSFTLPIISISASILTIFIVLLFAQSIEKSLKVETIILTGIIFSSFLGALISLMIALTGEELRQIIGWLLGSVSMRGWDYIQLILPFFLTGVTLLLIHAPELNAMSFGEEKAQHLGVNVQRKKLIVLLAGSILTGAAVAVSGTIGFVGLVIPHLIRILWGPDHRHLLPLSVLIGAGFLILTDLVSRTIISPTELPIGIITSLIGAPVFAVILLRKQRKGRGTA
ncbi:iron complex transport system permease protein [Bacillus ectoiniformans]|uniref:FecCD family ABC transporter permease n=1 Tax=Bacillus ectoiniformans TaxID=1494429 RepID=UPI00195C2018|nr:iron ABC transporter permease [Bacillus ectoiniformans]MBM7649556.1 iron complex transport system permease protein [Bacillus ectoiniformans]